MTWFGGSRRWWALGFVTALVAALTEPLMPALLKPLLDRGFTRGQLALWMVPVADHPAVRGARPRAVRLAVRAGAHRQRRHAAAAARAVRAPAGGRTRPVLAPVGQRPVEHGGLRGADRRHAAGAGAAGPVARRLHAGRAAGLPGLPELEADADRRRAGARRGLDHEGALQAPVPPHPARPAGHRRAGLRGRGERAGPPHGAPARRRGRARPSASSA